MADDRFPDFFGNPEEDPLLNPDDADDSEDAFSSADEAESTDDGTDEPKEASDPPSPFGAPQEARRNGDASLFGPPDKHERSPLFQDSSDADAPSGAASRHRSEAEQRALMIDPETSVAQLNDALHDGWRLLHVVPVGRTEASAETSAVSFSALVTLERTSPA